VRADAFICTKREPTHGAAHSSFFLRAPPLNYLYSVRLLYVCAVREPASERVVHCARFCGCKLVLSARRERGEAHSKTNPGILSAHTQTIQSITSGSFPGRKLRPVCCRSVLYLYLLCARLQKHHFCGIRIRFFALLLKIKKKNSKCNRF